MKYDVYSAINFCSESSDDCIKQDPVQTDIVSLPVNDNSFIIQSRFVDMDIERIVIAVESSMTM